MRILFVARAISGMAGGLERMIVALMNALVPRHEIFLFTWDRAPAEAFYPMAPEIVWRRLDMGDPARKAGIRLVLARWPAVRKWVAEIAPDVIVCFQGGAFRSMQLYTAGLGIPLIASERTSPTLYDHANSARARQIEHFAFGFADTITIQFERYRDLYPARLRSRIVTVPNPVPRAAKLAHPEVPGPDGRWRLLAVGRLGYQKNFDVLVDAFAGLAARFPDWDLRIVGEGEGRQALEAQVARSPELGGRVALPGATTDVATEYAAAHLFCLPSRWEGFPNALAEALAHGLPSVGFAGCAGIPDLITPGSNGGLATGNGDAAMLSAALAPLMAAPDERARLGRNAIESVAGYEAAQILALWEDTLSASASRNRRRGRPGQGTAAAASRSSP